MKQLHIKTKTKNSLANTSSERKNGDVILQCVTILPIIYQIKYTVLPVDWHEKVCEVPM